MFSKYSVVFRSGTEEQYAEKEQLLQEVVDMQREQEEQRKRKTSNDSRERSVAEAIRTQAMTGLRSQAQALIQTAAGTSSASIPAESAVSNICTVCEEAKAGQETG